MGHEFKPGDRVVCVDASDSADMLVRGHAYTVSLVQDRIIAVGGKSTWASVRFKHLAEVRVVPAKPRYSLVPFPALRAVVRVLTFGANAAHPKNDWATAFTVEDHLDAMFRHLDRAVSGEVYDPESGELHYAHAASRLLFVIAMTLTKEGK